MGQDGLQSPQLFRQENEQTNFITASSIPQSGWEPKYDSGRDFFELLLFFFCIILGKRGKTSGF